MHSVHDVLYSWVVSVFSDRQFCSKVFGLNTQNVGKFVSLHKSVIIEKHPAAHAGS